MNLRSTISALLADKQKLTWTIVWALVGIFLLRSCIINSWNSLPNEVVEKIQKQNVTCLTPDEAPLWPGDTRQPECGNVDIKILGHGKVPEALQEDGVTDAICYQASIQNPYISTLATTRHDVKWAARTVFKVTIRQNGSWEVFPDEAKEDDRRWATYSCPEQ